MKARPLVPFLLLLVLGLSISPANAASPPPLKPIVGHAVHADLSPALRDMRPLPPTEMIMGSPANLPLPKSLRDPLTRVEAWSDEALCPITGKAPMPAPLQSFDGVSNLDGVMPPDTQGDIGYDPTTGTKYYVQWVNLHFAIWDVTNTPTQVYGPASGNTLWQGFGGPCETNNDGDPITLYDPIAHRWLMSQFAVSGPYYQCIAVSQTADPTGAWYRYAFQLSTTKMNDYPKFGVWPDGYYMSINQFIGNSWAGAGVVVFERDKLLSGDASASFQYIDLQSVNSNYGGMLPSDLDGDTLPPTGSPNYFVEVDDSSWIGPSDAMRIWKFHVDWSNPNNTTFGINGNPNNVIPVASWTPACSSCIPQPNTSVQLDALSDRLMYRFAYRNFGDHESLVVNHTVDAGGHTGIRWYEVRDPGGTPTIYQQGTYSPDSNYRWMGSIAMDTSGNIALGYSVSSSSVYPSVRYAGRLASDPLGTLPQTETSLVTGGGSQTSSYHRWGDYSMLSIDPVDDCTFWYTQEYMASTSSGAWRTRIGSFRFPNCGAPTKGTLQGAVKDATTGQPIPQATISIQDEDSGDLISLQTGDDGHYAYTLTPSTYTVSARAYGYEPQTVSGLVIAQGITVTQDFALSSAPSRTISGTVRDARTGWPLYAYLHVIGDPTTPPAPDNATWSDPVTGFYSFTLPGSVTYTVQAIPWVAGYSPAQAVLPNLAHPTTQNFEMAANIGNAPLAPGYESNYQGTPENFNTATTPGGWSVVDNAGKSVQWQFDDPGGHGNKTGGTGAFAIVDSDYGGDVDVDTELRSPTYDFSASSTVMVEFKTDFRWWEFSQSEIADVDVSTDGGSTWTNVWRKAGGSLRGPQTVRVDISPQAAGQATVQVRFHYYNAHYEWWWQVDDVFIGPVTLDPQAGGLIVGNVYDANTHQPVQNALIVGQAPRNPTCPTTGESSGFYTRFAPQGNQLITATATNYGTISATVAVPLSDTVRHDFNLPAGLLALQPQTFHINMPGGTILTRTLNLSNSGGLPTTYTIQMINAPLPSVAVGPFAPTARRGAPDEYSSRTAESIRIYEPPTVPTLDAGHTVITWNSGLNAPWGIAVAAGHLWINDTKLGGGTATLRDFTPQGQSLGQAPEGLATAFTADMAYQPETDTLWQVSVGRDPCIYALDPATLQPTGVKLCPAFSTSQRGLAYDPATRTFYSGSWNTQLLYHFDLNGRLLASYDLHVNIAGLAYNPASRHLFVLSNAATGPDVFVFDMIHHAAPIGSFDIPGLGAYQQAGLALDGDGLLWTVNMETGEVLAVTSGESVNGWQNIPWLTVQPVAGTLPAHTTQPVVLTFNSQSLSPGDYPAYLRVDTGTPYPSRVVPLTLTVQTSYGFILTPSVSIQRGLPGSVVTHTFTITNTGSETDTFNVTITGQNWPLGGPTTVGPLASDQSALVVFTTTVPTTAACDASDEATVTFTSQGAPTVSRTAKLVTRAAPLYSAQLTLHPPSGSGGLGDAVTTTLWLTNTGNCTTTFNLMAQSEWPITLPFSAITLPVGAATHAPATVTILTDNTIAMQNVAVITANGSDGSQITARATFTVTRVEVPVRGVSFTYRPQFPKDGDVITFTGTVTAGTPPLTYTWNFGDGTPLAVGQVVTHVYAKQTSTLMHSYIVTLTVSNRLGSDSVQQPVTLNQEEFFVYMPLIIRQ